MHSKLIMIGSRTYGSCAKFVYAPCVALWRNVDAMMAVAITAAAARDTRSRGNRKKITLNDAYDRCRRICSAPPCTDAERAVQTETQRGQTAWPDIATHVCTMLRLARGMNSSYLNHTAV